MSKTYLITKEIFYTLLIALLIFATLELFWPKIVQAYINLNLLLILWIISGIILIVNYKK